MWAYKPKAEPQPYPGLEMMVRSRLLQIESASLQIQIFTTLTNMKIILVANPSLPYQSRLFY